MSSNENRPISPKRGRPRSKTPGRTVRFYLSYGLENKMYEYLKTHNDERPQMSRSRLIQKALAKYLKEEETYWPVLFNRMNNFTKEVREGNERIGMLCNLFTHFLAYHFADWAAWFDLPSAKKHERLAKAYRVIEKFSASVKDSLQEGTLWQFDPQYIKELILQNAKELDLEEMHKLAEEEKREARAKVEADPE